MNREDVERALQLALATMTASETPEWLRDMAEDEYWTLAMHLQVDPELSSTGEFESGLWCTYGGEYGGATNELLDQLPDEIKSAQRRDVLCALALAKGADKHGYSVDARLEYVFGLHRTLQRLLTSAASTESFDSLSDESYFLLAHFAKIAPLPDDGDDDDEYDDEEHYERSTNGID
ncbi:hypothetical protein CRM90_27915 [Mycobacterium sp. ENV421]|uniref:hypothetical protein n=1 Tax=Mycobacterium sp. ENV421 TaxID=1213407 RepID=UPI000C9BB91D|nr:hypothetical protein [Mycobacterium sp. ENV421]PND54429.1 hypothetical protein CRM90_27915 [Mycobacterium sp. ENV421]